MITTTRTSRTQDATRTTAMVLFSEVFVISWVVRSFEGAVSGASEDSSAVSEGVSVSVASVSLSSSDSVSVPLSLEVGV